MRFQRYQKDAEYKNHRNQRLCCKELPNQKINGKSAEKNTDRKQNIFLSLLMLHNASPNYFYKPIILHEQKRFKVQHRIMLLHTRFFTKSTLERCYDIST